MWVALRGDRLLARAAWWTRPGGDAPFLLDVLDVDDSLPAPARLDIGGQLLRTAIAATHPAGSRPPQYTRFVPPGRWRPRRPRIPAAGRGQFLLAALISLLAWAVAYVVLALVPSYTAAALGRSNLLVDGTAAGSLLLVAALAQAACRTWA